MRIRWIDIILIIVGLFVAYQMVRYLLGGSWGIDALSLGLLFVIAGVLWKMNIDIVKMGMKLDGHFRWHKNRGDK